MSVGGFQANLICVFPCVSSHCFPLARRNLAVSPFLSISSLAICTSVQTFPRRGAQVWPAPYRLDIVFCFLPSVLPATRNIRALASPVSPGGTSSCQRCAVHTPARWRVVVDFRFLLLVFRHAELFPTLDAVYKHPYWTIKRRATHFSRVVSSWRSKMSHFNLEIKASWLVI